MATLSDVFKAGIEEVRKSWGWFLVLGILLMILGGMCIVKAQTATTFSILALGWVLAISGVFWFIGSFQALGWGGFFIYLLNALIRGVTGYLLIRHPDAGAAGVTMLLAVTLHRRRTVSHRRRECYSFPLVGVDVLCGTDLGRSRRLPVGHLGYREHLFFGIAIGVDLIFDGGALVAFGAAIHSLPEA